GGVVMEVAVEVAAGWGDDDDCVAWWWWSDDCGGGDEDDGDDGLLAGAWPGSGRKNRRGRQKF
ncbi:hypothetical protein Tco_0358149, partial [Tanacetum coccineum]